MHRSRTLCGLDVAHDRALPLTSVARTLVDVAEILDAPRLRRAVREARGACMVDLARLAEAAERLRPRPGAARIAGLVAAGPAPTRSELEDVVLDLTAIGGLARPAVNVPLVVAGRRAIPDFRRPAQRLVVEPDGAAWHDDPAAREDDAQRQALLEANGERVVRVTWRQVTARRGETLDRLLAAGAPPAGPHGSLSAAGRPLPGTVDPPGAAGVASEH